MFFRYEPHAAHSGGRSVPTSARAVVGWFRSCVAASLPAALLLTTIWLATISLASPARADFAGNPDLREINADPSTPWTEFVSVAPGIAGNGTATDEEIGSHFVTFPAWSLDEAPIPQQEREILIAEFAAEGIDYRESNEILVIDVVAAARTEADALADGGSEIQVQSGYSCASWMDYRRQDTHTFERSRSLDETWGDEPGDKLSGSVHGSASFTASLDYDVLVQVRISPWYAGCVPYKLRLKHARAQGQTAIDTNVTIDAEFEHTTDWTKEKTLFDQTVYSIDFAVGPVPVHLPIGLSFGLGVHTEAEVRASARFEAQADATGTIAIDCTSETCNTSTDLDWSHQGEIPSLDATIEAKAQLYAKAQLDISLYHRNVLAAGVRAKGGAEARLWGYYGNQCGDADGNGTNETVQGLTTDLYAFYDIDAVLESSAFDDKSWNLFDGYHHLWFDDLLNGNSTALEPMIVGPASVESGVTTAWEIRMRPCYPYEDALSVAWASSAGQDNFGGAGTLSPGGKLDAAGQLHTGTRTLYAQLGGDPFRDLSAYEQTRTVQVSLPSVGKASSYEHFGHSMAAGDFDCDGFADLAIGSPDEDGNGLPDGGMAQVSFGRSGAMPHNSDAKLLLFADGPESTAGRDNHFGFAMTSGDYDDDGCDDLTISMPGRGSDGGAVRVFYGDPDGDLTKRMTYINQNHATVPGSREAGDRFGEGLATGDINGDGYDDLAVAAPGHGYQANIYGNTFVFYGSQSGIHQANAPLQTRAWNQSTYLVPNHREHGDGYSMRVALGDFDGDGYDDLAIGYPHEDVEVNADGSVIVIHGSQSGLVGSSSYELLQSQAGGSSPEERDYFGSQLTSADFDGDGYDDLVVTAPGEDWSTTPNAGTAHVLWGNVAGLGNGNRYFLTSSWGTLETDAWFGASVATGDVNGDGYPDLLVGATNVTVGGKSGGGRVYIAYSDGDRTFTQPTNQYGKIDRNTAYVDGAVVSGAGFGSSLVCADFDGNGVDDMVAGARWDKAHGRTEAGTATVVKGYTSGLLPTTSTSHLLSQQN